MDNRIRQSTILTTDLKTLYSVIIGILPVIMSISVPFINIGLSTAFICLFSIYAIKRLKIGHKLALKLVIGLAFVYLMIRSSQTPFNIFLLALVYIHIIGFSNGTLDILVTRKTIETVSYISAYILFFQTILFYLLGIRSSLLIEALLIDENKYYVAKQVIDSGLYRPSAFFLEPSHYAEYCCIGLLSVLFPNGGQKPNVKKAMIIALGCLFTTSGIGMALCVGIFIVYAVFAQRAKGTRLQYIVLWLIVGVAAVAVLMRIPFIQTALQRITGDVNGYNAIWGRTLYWDRYIGSMSLADKIFGYGYGNLPSGYMTGLMLLIYCYGYVGIGLLLLSLVYIAVRGKNAFTFFLIGIYVALMSVANLFGFISLTFWYSLMISSSLEGINNARKE